jgi:hypothetical protein
MWRRRIIRHKRNFFPTGSGTVRNRFDAELTEENARPCRAIRLFCSGFALPSGMASLPDNLSWPQAAGLILAVSMLRQTESVVNAIKQADIASGQPQPVVGIGPHPNRLGGRRLEEPKFEPRRHITPSPVYEPRLHIRQRPIVTVCPPKPCPRDESQPLDPAIPEGTPVSSFKIQPPWKDFPWKNPTPAEPKPKVIVRLIDKSRRGQMIDLFI